MKRGILVLSLFLVSVLFISGCAEFGPEKVEKAEMMTPVLDYGSSNPDHQTNGNINPWYSENIGSFPRWTSKADPLHLCYNNIILISNPLTIDSMMDSFYCMEGLTLMYMGLQFGDDEICLSVGGMVMFDMDDTSFWGDGLCESLVGDNGLVIFFNNFYTFCVDEEGEEYCDEVFTNSPDWNQDGVVDYYDFYYFFYNEPLITTSENNWNEKISKIRNNLIN